MSTTVDNNLSNFETIDFGQVPTTVSGRIFMGRQVDRADNGNIDDDIETRVTLIEGIIRDLSNRGFEPLHRRHPHSKPSNTVTKEEIESSGMEVITTQKLEQYAKEEKVTTACTGQCIICLEEYKGEDEVRVTNCKHAFHRRCIDNWMETGKNNCPACRSECIKRSKEAEAGGV